MSKPPAPVHPRRGRSWWNFRSGSAAQEALTCAPPGNGRKLRRRGRGPKVPNGISSDGGHGQDARATLKNGMVLPPPLTRSAVAAACLLVAGLRADPPPVPPEAEKIGENRYRVGKLTVDLVSKTAVCAGKINMQRSTVEYLAVAPGGKRHESVLLLQVRPLHLQVGLILLGLEPRGGLRYQGDTQVPKGSPLDLWVSWQRGGRTVKVAAGELVWDGAKRRPMGRGDWVFSGSRVDADGFVADRDLSLIGTYRDPGAIINNALPEGADDTVYKVNERVCPPAGTPVTFTVTPREVRQSHAQDRMHSTCAYLSQPDRRCGMRMNVAFPDDVMEDLRQAVPPGKRTEFVVEATRLRLLRERQRQALAAAAGSWSDESQARLDTAEGARRFLDELRAPDEERRARLEAL